MKENEIIKERRKNNFLDKINRQKEDYKETKKNPSKNKIIIESNTNKIKSKLDEDSNSDNDNNNINNKHNDDNDINNHKASYKINYFDNFKKVNKYEYIKNILDLFKKILVILLTLFHCLKYLSLDDSTKLKYSLIILEISSFLVNKLYNIRMRKFIENKKIIEIESDFDNKRGDDFGFNKLIKFLEKIFEQIIPLKYVFEILGLAMDIITDIAILFITNVIFFIIYEDDE